MERVIQQRKHAGKQQQLSTTKLTTVKLTVVLCVLLACLCGQSLSDEDGGGHHGVEHAKMEINAFQDCVTQCSNDLNKCTQPSFHFFDNYEKHRKRIGKAMVQCCLAHEHDHKQPASASYARCTKVNCLAAVWGCQFAKKHSGGFSQSEVEFLKENKMKKKEG